MGSVEVSTRFESKAGDSDEDDSGNGDAVSAGAELETFSDDGAVVDTGVNMEISVGRSVVDGSVIEDLLVGVSSAIGVETGVADGDEILAVISDWMTTGSFQVPVPFGSRLYDFPSTLEV